MRFDITPAIGAAIFSLALSAGSAQAGVPEAGGPSATAQQPPATSQGPATTPAQPASPSGATYSDAEIEQFAKAVLEVQKIQQDTTASTADKQTKMAAAVQAAGLTPQKFNEIASASNADPALMQRIQLAAGKVQGAGGAQ